MRANKWRGSENARHGYSTHFGAGGSIDKRRCETKVVAQLGALWHTVWTGGPPVNFARRKGVVSAALEHPAFTWHQ